MEKRNFNSGDIVIFTAPDSKETRVLTLISEYPELHGWSVKEDDAYVFMTAYFRKPTKLDKALR